MSTKAGGNARWSSNGPDGQLLHSLIMSGNLGPGISAGQVQSMYPQFAKYNGNAFATNLRRVRQLYAAGELQDGNGLSSALVINKPPPPVMARTTPSSPACRPSISFASSVGHQSAEKTLNDSFSGLNVDDDAEEARSLAMCGSPAVSSARASHVFGSAPTDVSHFFWTYPWFDCHSNHRLTYYILLSSLTFEYYNFLVSPCGWYLQILMRIPSMMTDTMQLTSKLHRKSDGTPAFGMDNIRYVNHRLAVESLFDAMGVTAQQGMVLTQSIRLPFQVDGEFCKLDGTDGLILKFFKETGMKIAVVEMIGIKSSRNHSTAIRQVQQQHYIDEVSLSGYYTTVPRQLDVSGASVVSYNPRTRAPRASPVSGDRIPTAINVRKLSEITETGGGDDDNEQDEDDDLFSIPSARPTEGGKRRVISSPKKKTVINPTTGTFLRLTAAGELDAAMEGGDEEPIVGQGYEVNGVLHRK